MYEVNDIYKPVNITYDNVIFVILFYNIIFFDTYIGDSTIIFNYESSILYFVDNIMNPRNLISFIERYFSFFFTLSILFLK